MKKFLFSFFLIGTFASYALFTQQSVKSNSSGASVVLDNRRSGSAPGTDAALALAAPAPSAATPLPTTDSPQQAPPTPPNAQLNAQAQGIVQIASSYSVPMTLVKTTRLVSTDGKVYRLAQEIIVPARGRVSATVYADQNGSAYAIGPTSFSIPGLDSSLQQYVTASSSSAFALAKPLSLATAAQSSPAPVAPPTSPTPPTPPKPKHMYNDGTFVGTSADAYYGYVQVQAVIRNGRIADVQFLDHPQDRSRSVYINEQAMPYLTSEAIQAQSANVDAISGATLTSRGFIESLSSALSKARA